MTVGAELGQSSLWRDSGGSGVRRRVRVPDVNVISSASTAGKADRPLVARIGEHLSRAFDYVIASSSLVANDPVLDVRDFPWTAGLRDNWAAIREEAIRLARPAGALPGGATIEHTLARCPHTAVAVARIPGLHSASFSTLAPGAHIPERRGATKGLITCHLGLIIPRDGDVRMRVHDRTVRWAEGETLVFDDTYRHEVWNDTNGTRVVLLIRFERPLRNPGKWIADMVLRVARRSDPARLS
ncbi:beta-hydroxylase [Sphingomonas sp. PP-F2F-G114-C0414]|uniref:aspartyl/asparaginyl beta-hydroxylase domain-containing protein n=1 Tax=Sphingomonas sp. PP-F2F-G114-C0414 TaxID=2135662 RepID=UPI000EF8A6A9|nr:aspartyl/asparaginyl beta-hydroxylase domain-containing protein [Sphingomonas sp. PP-F2F-G114-C0414]RMB28632.1 beta-hydroxylase [Sphingomonas sp. PP-F2F-G114-C0414]